MSRTTCKLFVYAAILFLAGLSSAYAQAENRVALVIGNGAYATSPLKNPTNDAQDMAAALRGVGFDVIHRENVGRSEMRAAIREFSKKIRQGGVGLFYFAGHGVQVNERNYLIPVGANIEQEYEVADEAVDADSVLRAMGHAENHLNIIILDACRNNPFARSFRSVERGLAKMSAPKGSLVSYATAPGDVAADGEGRNGLYTKYLLEAMQVPGIRLEQVFKQVRINVSGDTAGGQVPWEESSLTGDFYFRPGTAVAAAPVATAPAANSLVAAPQQSAEARYWVTVENSQDPVEYNAYLQKYPDGEYADIARARRDRYTGTATYVPSNTGQGNQRALINPVYYGNAENPYATVAVRDFVDTRTPFQVVEINPVMALPAKLSGTKAIGKLILTTRPRVRSRKISGNNYSILLAAKVFAITLSRTWMSRCEF
jgi:hypothetical protein